MKKNLIIVVNLLLFVLVIASCKKDDSIEYKLKDPIIVSQEVNGKHFSINWTHDCYDYKIVYSIKINDVIYNNPDKFFSEELEYGRKYSGEIIAEYPDKKMSSIKFEFSTEKRNDLLILKDKILYSIDLYEKATNWGKQISTSNTPYTIWRSSIIVCNTEIAGYSLKTGEKEWSFTPEGGINAYSENFLEGDILYISEYDRGTTAVDLSSRKLLWRSHYKGSKLVVGDYVYVSNSFSAPILLALKKQTGELIWGFEGDPNTTSAYPVIYSQPVLNENAIYFGDNIGRIYSVNASSGKKKWSLNIGPFQGSFGAPIIYEENLIIPVYNKIYSINKTTSAINWIYSHEGQLIYSAP